MKCEYRDGKHKGRVLVVSDIPATDGIEAPREIEIQITYLGDTGVGNAIALDNQIIPTIIAALNL